MAKQPGTTGSAPEGGPEPASDGATGAALRGGTEAVPEDGADAVPGDETELDAATEGEPQAALQRAAAHHAPEELRDLRVLKALAQPRRQQMLQHLTVHGPATSATLARDLGLNTGATSYHLRELARYGFVEETGGAGHGRERWWRAVPGDRRFPPRSRQNAETRLVMDELNHLSYAADLELFEQLQRDGGPELGEWADAFPYSRGTIRLTLPELREFFEEYIALLNRYKRPDAETPADARTVLTRLLAFPAPELPDEPAHPDATDATDAPATPDPTEPEATP
ncbi:helix-turn-helix domain-containing protein [Streptomyces sp. NPDC050844]|uniref:ArsR/SmtB family transcription factor n=1 Tax=Streptomyces sp. NPDC050844 TaxID=3155790 RepID=UPI0033EF45C8